MAKVKNAKISDLIPDDKNANKGTEYGKHLMDKSFRQFGAGRSILVDKNNKIIAGNKSTEQCAEIGIEDVIIIESDGTKLIAVKRTDIDINTKQGRELCLADNSTGKANLEWDKDMVNALASTFEIDAKDWGIPDFAEKEDEPEPEPIKEISKKLIITCNDHNQLNELFNELQERGFRCELKE